MMNYEKLFEPFTEDGCSLDMMVDWVRKKTGASEQILTQAVAETMQKISDGEEFLPVEGRPINNVHTTINHYLLSLTGDLMMQINSITFKLIEDRQKVLLENQMKQISNFDSDYDKMMNGTWGKKVRKFIGLPYEHWGNE